MSEAGEEEETSTAAAREEEERDGATEADVNDGASNSGEEETASTAASKQAISTQKPIEQVRKLDPEKERLKKLKEKEAFEKQRQLDRQRLLEDRQREQKDKPKLKQSKPAEEQVEDSTGQFETFDKVTEECGASEKAEATCEKSSVSDEDNAVVEEDSTSSSLEPKEDFVETDRKNLAQSTEKPLKSSKINGKMKISENNPHSLKSSEGIMGAVVTPSRDKNALEQSTCRTQRLIDNLAFELEEQKQNLANITEKYAGFYRMQQPMFEMEPPASLQPPTEADPSRQSGMPAPFFNKDDVKTYFHSYPDVEVLFSKSYTGPGGVIESHYGSKFGTVPNEFSYGPNSTVFSTRGLGRDKQVGESGGEQSAFTPVLTQSDVRYENLTSDKPVEESEMYQKARTQLGDVTAQLRKLKEHMQEMDSIVFQSYRRY